MSECPNALLPDGPTCPRCGQPRGPSGVDGGTWVHFTAKARALGARKVGLDLEDLNPSGRKWNRDRTEAEELADGEDGLPEIDGEKVKAAFKHMRPRVLEGITDMTTALDFAQDNWMKQARLAAHYMDILEEKEREIISLRKELAEAYRDLADAEFS